MDKQNHHSKQISPTILTVIPARGGSKGIPRKNVQLLAGKPLLAHTIETAKASPSIQRIIVSTDDPEIAMVASQYGAEVVWRPAEISGDNAPSELALLHALEHLERTEGYIPDLLVFLQCTAPLTTAEDIEGTIQALVSQQADTALAVVPFHYFLWRVDETGNAVGINHDKRVRPMRQEREPQYLEAGAVYVMRAEGFKRHRHRFFGKTVLYVMPAERRWEIDEPIDLTVAEVLLAEQRRSKAMESLPNPVRALVLDFDGVITDNRVMISQDGTEAVLCHRGDGWGIVQLKERGIPVLVLSTEANPVVKARCQKLNVPCIQGVRDKREALQVWLEQQGIQKEHVVYVGNDINDLACMNWVGCGVAVSDAVPEVRRLARLVLQHRGGSGAVREIVDLIMSKLQGGVRGKISTDY